MTKDVVIQVRLSTDEHKAWTKAAELEQMPLAAWIRRRCNGLSAAAPQTYIHSAPGIQLPKKPTKKGGK